MLDRSASPWSDRSATGWLRTSSTGLRPAAPKPPQSRPCSIASGVLSRFRASGDFFPPRPEHSGPIRNRICMAAGPARLPCFGRSVLRWSLAPVRPDWADRPARAGAYRHWTRRGGDPLFGFFGDCDLTGIDVSCAGNLSLNPARIVVKDRGLSPRRGNSEEDLLGLAPSSRRLPGILAPHRTPPYRTQSDRMDASLSQPRGRNRYRRFLIKITGAIREAFRSAERNDPGVQSPIETLDRGAGSCRDFALFMAEAVRSVGLAARFVSGYLYDPAIDGRASEIVGARCHRMPGFRSISRGQGGWNSIRPMVRMAGTVSCPLRWPAKPAQAKPVSGTYAGDPQDFLEMSIEVTVRATQVLHGQP